MIKSAKAMRELAENKQNESDYEWWSKFEVKLSEEIQMYASGGNFQLSINKDSKLNEYDFINCKRLCDLAEEQLRKQGYEVIYSAGSYQMDGDDKSLIIKW